MDIEFSSLEELPVVAKKLIDSLNGKNLWAFEGQMGAGKTTLILEVLNQLGVEGAEGSPTYSLVNTYESKSGQTIYHFDLYRVNSIEEALDMGIEDLIYDDALCLIEWPKIIEDLLPKETIWMYLSVKDDNHSRILSYSL